MPNCAAPTSSTSSTLYSRARWLSTLTRNPRTRKLIGGMCESQTPSVPFVISISLLSFTSQLPFRCYLLPEHILRRQSQMSGSEGPDPILLTLFANRFMSVAEAMGRSLQQTSISTNIKERLDFSCALFAPDGDLVANAPFIPIHLGSMSLCV